jgi:hypothetical protein
LELETHKNNDKFLILLYCVTVILYMLLTKFWGFRYLPFFHLSPQKMTKFRNAMHVSSKNWKLYTHFIQGLWNMTLTISTHGRSWDPFWSIVLNSSSEGRVTSAVVVAILQRVNKRCYFPNPYYEPKLKTRATAI